MLSNIIVFPENNVERELCGYRRFSLPTRRKTLWYRRDPQQRNREWDINVTVHTHFGTAACSYHATFNNENMGKSASQCKNSMKAKVMPYQYRCNVSDRQGTIEPEEKEVNRLLHELVSIIPKVNLVEQCETFPATEVLNGIIEYIVHLEDKVGPQNTMMIRRKLSVDFAAMLRDNKCHSTQI